MPVKPFTNFPSSLRYITGLGARGGCEGRLPDQVVVKSISSGMGRADVESWAAFRHSHDAGEGVLTAPADRAIQGDNAEGFWSTVGSSRDVRRNAVKPRKMMEGEMRSRKNGVLCRQNKKKRPSQ